MSHSGASRRSLQLLSLHCFDPFSPCPMGAELKRLALSIPAAVHNIGFAVSQDLRLYALSLVARMDGTY